MLITSRHMTFLILHLPNIYMYKGENVDKLNPIIYGVFS